jgi:hypothetical protein
MVIIAERLAHLARRQSVKRLSERETAQRSALERVRTAFTDKFASERNLPLVAGLYT